MKKSCLAILLWSVFAGSSSAQLAPEKVRFEAITGVVLPGEIASADFIADFSTFGGTRVERTDGFLDVDPGFWGGVRASYRLRDRLTLSATWMHHRGRFRVQFPAEASIAGNFDLEGLLLAGSDFGTGQADGLRAERAMNDAITDLYMVQGTWEFPVLSRWALPFVTIGGGLLTQKSDGNVFEFVFSGDVPAGNEVLEASGLTTEEFAGLLLFQVNETDPVISIGGGVRISISDRWAVSLRGEDFIRVGADLSDINGSSPEPDPEAGRVYSTSFRGKEGLIHNYGVQVALNYSLWPSGAPR